MTPSVRLVFGLAAVAVALFPVPGSAALPTTRLAPSDNPTNVDDGFGKSVAVSGSTIMVGAPGGRIDELTPSAVYVFGPEGGTWTQRQKLIPADNVKFSAFGAALAISGDTAVIGAEGAAVEGHDFPGAAYVYVRSGETWMLQQKLFAVDGTGAPVGLNGEGFGNAVSISGDTVLVGAKQTNGSFGAAFVFVRSGATWSLQQKLTGKNQMLAELFGASVSVSGDTAVVGAPFGMNGGVGYIFARSAAVWTLQQQVQPSDAHAYDGFGSAVSVSETTAFVGPYPFVRSGATWTPQTKLAPPDESWDFGAPVSISGTTVIFGASFVTGPNSIQGAAYLFTQSGATWTASPRIAAADGMAGDSFGGSVSTAGGTFVVGAPPPASGLRGGAAYVGGKLPDAADASVDDDASSGADGAPGDADATGDGGGNLGSDGSHAMDAGGDEADGSPTGAAGGAAGALDAGGPTAGSGDGHASGGSTGSAGVRGAGHGCGCAVSDEGAAPALVVVLTMLVAAPRARRRQTRSTQTP